MRTRALYIKSIVVAIFCFLGSLLGIFFPKYILGILDLIRGEEPYQVPYVLWIFLWGFLLFGYTLMYVVGLLFSQYFLSLLPLVPFWSSTNENDFDEVLLYIDFSWAWLAAHSVGLFAGFFSLIYDAAARSSGLWFHFWVYFFLLVYNIVLNYYVCPKFCSKQQKKYFFGPMVNSIVILLFRKIIFKIKFKV